MKPNHALRTLLFSLAVAALLPGCKSSPTGPGSDAPSTVGYVTPLSVEYYTRSLSLWKCPPELEQDLQEVSDQTTTAFGLIAMEVTSVAAGSGWSFASAQDSALVNLSTTASIAPTLRFEKVGSSVGGLSGTVTSSASSSRSDPGAQYETGYSTSSASLNFEFRFRVDDAAVDLVVEQSGAFTQSANSDFEVALMKADQPHVVERYLHKEEYHATNDPKDWSVRCEVGREYVLRIDTGCSSGMSSPSTPSRSANLTHTFQALFKKPSE